MTREPIKKSVRFEVFKRDSFTCQYCGMKAPDVVLELDHITPVAEGGDNDILNLLTACRACNSGKSDRVLSDRSAIELRRAQLEDLEDRRQQLEMMHEWHVSLVGLDGQAADMAADLWFRSVGMDGAKPNDKASAELRKLIKKHGFDAVCDGIREAAEAVMRSQKDRMDACNEMFWKIGKIVAVQKADAEDPGLKRLFYIRGILRNRCHYLNEWQCLSLLQEARDAGISLDWLEQFAKRVTSWSRFRDEVSATLRDGPPNDQEATDGQST